MEQPFINKCALYFVGYQGINCEVNINDCLGVNCHNGACIDGLGEFTCRCREGFSGKYCQYEVDECASTPCQYGGTCTDLINGYQCRCPFGTTGKWGFRLKKQSNVALVWMTMSWYID